jgi:predicted NBD/HSP70 family sugar kinase
LMFPALVSSAGSPRPADILLAMDSWRTSTPIGIANAVELLNPSLIVLAGEFARVAREFFLEAVTRTIREQCFETMSRGLQIRVAPFYKDVGPVGCALLASLDLAREFIERALFVSAR